MKAVNAVTQFLLKKMMAVETENRAVMLVDIYDQTKKAGADSAAPEEEVETAALQSSKLAVAMNVALNMRELIHAVAKAGRLICEVADPAMVEASGAKLSTPEELSAQAKEAGSGLVMVLQTLNELLPAVQTDIDDEHIAEMLIKEGRKVRDAEKAEKAEPNVKAKPVAGWAVPFGKRIEPSSN